jgi:RimJ/RimL family protein N-acetyltransferase
MTLRYVLDQHELVADFVAQMIPHVRGHGFGKCCAIGVVNGDDELIAGIVYHNYVPEAGLIEMSAAALPGHLWATRTTLKLMHQFPFLQCGCQMLLAKVLADNTRMLRQFAALNYSFIKLPRIFGRNRDGVLCCLTYEDWLDSFLCKRYKHHIVDSEQIERAA